MTTQRIELLRSMPALGGLKTESIELILDQSDDVDARQGDYFFREGEPGDSLFVLETGQVRIERVWKGEPVLLGRLGEGDCFGEMALIDFMPRSASVIAESDCRAIEVASRSLRALFKQDLEQYAMIMMNLGREVSRRLRLADQRYFQLQREVNG